MMKVYGPIFGSFVPIDHCHFFEFCGICCSEFSHRVSSLFSGTFKMGVIPRPMDFVYSLGICCISDTIVTIFAEPLACTGTGTSLRFAHTCHGYPLCRIYIVPKYRWGVKKKSREKLESKKFQLFVEHIREDRLIFEENISIRPDPSPVFLDLDHFSIGRYGFDGKHSGWRLINAMHFLAGFKHVISDWPRIKREPGNRLKCIPFHCNDASRFLGRVLEHNPLKFLSPCRD